LFGRCLNQELQWHRHWFTKAYFIWLTATGDKYRASKRLQEMWFTPEQKWQMPKLSGLHHGLSTEKFIASMKREQHTLFRPDGNSENWEKINLMIFSGHPQQFLKAHTFSGVKKGFT